MIDVFVLSRGKRFLGFVPRQAMWFGGPTKLRMAQISYEYPSMPDGWVYKRSSAKGNTLRKCDRWQRLG